ncbi:hypothetical protein [Methanogenium cariaci]|uniref:hypothetical protein n=1 Tax=Methanogenium cariaci TaxID=2197 RepID=UPI001FE18157|nr:hypothetical protein [Methanogenium cariaci]
MIAKNRLPVIYALLAAMLFGGASAPAAKILLTEIEPVTLGAVLYRKWRGSADIYVA